MVPVKSLNSRARTRSCGQTDFCPGSSREGRPRAGLGRIMRGLFGRQDRDRDRIVLDSADLQHKRACRNLVLHGLADAVAIGSAAEGFWLQGVSILHHVDPAAGGQAHRVYAGLRRSLEAGEAGKRAFLRRAFRRRRQLGLGRCAQSQGHPGRGQGGKLTTGGKFDAIRRGQRRAFAIDVPFELVAAARFFGRPCGGGWEQEKCNEERPAHDQSTAIMTSEALTTPATWPLALMPRSSTASLVIDEVIICPLPISTRTWEVVAPFLTSRTVPLIWLRALMRMMVSTLSSRDLFRRGRDGLLIEKKMGLSSRF